MVNVNYPYVSSFNSFFAGEFVWLVHTDGSGYVVRRPTKPDQEHRHREFVAFVIDGLMTAGIEFKSTREFLERWV